MEQQAFVADKKAIIFDMMIDIAEKEYQIDIRKNLPPEQSTNLKNKKNKHNVFLRLVRDRLAGYYRRHQKKKITASQSPYSSGFGYKNQTNYAQNWSKETVFFF